MSDRCESCNQEVEPSMEQVVSDRLFVYDTAYKKVKEHMEADEIPEPMDVLQVALFLSGDIQAVTE